MSFEIMGILNVTPDSFYDGGKFDGTDRAVARAMQMIGEGADIIDIGGESTGPNSKTVSAEEELRRVIPVIETMRKYDKCDKCNKYLSHLRIDSIYRISVDTYKSKVAEAALDAGAAMVNDVTAGRGDPAMFPLIAERRCMYIMMHSKDDSPRTTVESRSYEDVLGTIHDFFEERIGAAVQAGIARDQLILDPGLGHFVSNDPQYSWHILEHLEFLQDFGCRILVSPSRKSFTAEHQQQSPAERLPGTLRATALAIAHGVAIIRTHDVKETKAISPLLP